MSLESYDLFSVDKFNAYAVSADPINQKRLTNVGGGKLFYKTASDVDTGDTELAVGASVTLEATNWIISESTSRVLVVPKIGEVVQDLTVNDKAYVVGELEVDGDFNHDGSKVGVFGVAPATRPEVKKSALTANELATALATMGIVKVEA